MSTRRIPPCAPVVIMLTGTPGQFKLGIVVLQAELAGKDLLEILSCHADLIEARLEMLAEHLCHAIRHNIRGVLRIVAFFDPLRDPRGAGCHIKVDDIAFKFRDYSINGKHVSALDVRVAIFYPCQLHRRSAVWRLFMLTQHRDKMIVSVLSEVC